jgi:hypothetical protein
VERTLLKALKDKKQDSSNAILALRWFPSREASYQLVEILRNVGRHAQDRARAADALGEHSSEIVVDPLLTALRDREPYVIIAAAQSLRKHPSRLVLECLCECMMRNFHESIIVRHVIDVIYDISYEMPHEFLLKPMLQLLTTHTESSVCDAAKEIYIRIAKEAPDKARKAITEASSREEEMNEQQRGMLNEVMAKVSLGGKIHEEPAHSRF